ncbi:MAG TPA: hypothetical protein VIE36_13940 [Methylomirabilota bacterium]|jgi:hypothetical protein
MKSARLVLAWIVLVATPIVAVAAPGDPRLVNGVLEWPRTLTNESFVIVRGDDGVLYYVGLTAARRDGTAAAGSRVAVLGIEGRSSHEIAAVGFGSGATTEAALAQLQGARQPAAPVAAPAPSAPPAAPAAAAPAPAAPPAAAAPASPSVAQPTAPASTPLAPVVAPATPSPTPVATPPAAASPPPAPSAPAAVTPRPAPATPAPAVTAQPTAPAGAPTNGGTAAGAPTPVPSGVVPTAATSPKAGSAPAPISGSAPMIPVDDRRWTEVSGEIEAFLGRTVLLKVDGGRVTVDVSSLSGNLERLVAPGSKVKFYGVPVELRFKAMGFIDPDARGRAR